MSSPANELDALQPVMPLREVLLMLLAVVVGALAALVALPTLLPGLSVSLAGPAPQAFWYLSRAAAIIAYLLMWLSIVFGLLISNKLSRVWPGGPLAVDLHQFTSLLGFAFALFHGLILLGDRYINYTPLQLLIPFGSINYQPFWVGLGQLAFYLTIPVAFSFYIRKRIGFNLWRSLHYASFIVYAFITVHALLAGSDTTTSTMLGFYALTGAAVSFLTINRILTMLGAEVAHGARGEYTARR